MANSQILHDSQPANIADFAQAEAVPPCKTQRKISRRRLLGGMLASGSLAALGGAGYAWRIEPVWPEVVYQRMPLPGLGPEFQGARIIQISDLHVGAKMDLDYLQKWAGWVSAQQADFVLVTGDSVNYSAGPGTAIMAKLVGGLRAREAVLAILGNHEWGAWHPQGGQAGLAQRAANALKDRGVRVLRNQVASFRRGRSELNVVGLDDCWCGNYYPDDAFRTLASESPTIVMSHNPDSVMDLLDRPGHWVLSGHTHGGQVNIPLFGPPLLPVAHKEYVAGHYRVASKNLYVNRGLGWIHRVRFNARPEITVFTLEAEQA